MARAVPSQWHAKLPPLWEAKPWIDSPPDTRWALIPLLAPVSAVVGWGLGCCILLLLLHRSDNLGPEWFGQLTSMMAKFNSTGHTVLAENVSAPGGFYQDSVVIAYKGSYITFERILTTLTAIDFSDNRLEGTIPESVGRLVSLHVLNMSHNAFTGKIPSQLGGMAALESLDLSCNKLSGEIPQELTDLTFMSILNLSNNQLVGKIPQSRQFFTFENSSFEGNLGLCGLPLSISCGASPAPPSAAHANDSSDVDVVLFLFSGLGFGVGFAAAILTRWSQIGE